MNSRRALCAREFGTCGPALRFFPLYSAVQPLRAPAVRGSSTHGHSQPRARYHPGAFGFAYRLILVQSGQPTGGANALGLVATYLRSLQLHACPGQVQTCTSPGLCGCTRGSLCSCCGSKQPGGRRSVLRPSLAHRVRSPSLNGEPLNPGFNGVRVPPSCRSPALLGVHWVGIQRIPHRGFSRLSAVGLCDPRGRR